MTFRIAISGIRAASSDLDVIGNNVANSNTTGFKKSRAEFADVYAISDLGTSSNTPGSGVRVTDIAQQFTQGNITFTDNNLDLAINGGGFFIVDDAGAQAFTRNGAFGIDKDGYLSNSREQQLIAFDADSAGNITGTSGPLFIDTSNISPVPTNDIELTVNLDSQESVPTAATFDITNPNSFNHSTSTTVYDSLGTSHTATFYFVKTATANAWETYTYVDGTQVDGPDTMTFTNSGIFSTPAGGTITTPSFAVSGGATTMQLTIDHGDSTQFGSDFSVFALSQDGFPTGRLSELDIDSEGIIFARFTNGQSRVEGQVALADVPNIQGLQPVSDTSWAETFSSGAAVIGRPGTSSLGLIQSGALEESNVELSEELVNMIIAQRMFQANAEVITTADSVTQTIINIR